MRASWRLATVTGILTLTAAGLYACSSDETPAIATPPGTEAGTDTGPGADTGPGKDSAPGQDTGTDTSVPPMSCPIFEGDAGRIPDYAPTACRACAKEKCCTPITKCYGAAPADAGLDGSNGSKTQCQLAGECLERCAGSVVCEAQCQVDYGQPAINDFEGPGACIDAPAPAGCMTLCN